MKLEVVVVRSPMSTGPRTSIRAWGGGYGGTQVGRAVMSPATDGGSDELEQ